VIDVLVCERRDTAASRSFFARALARGASPLEVTTDRAPVYPRVIDQFVPAARHVLEQYANNRVEADHGRLKARLRPMRGLKTVRSCAPSLPGTLSCRTCAAVTTRSPSTRPPTTAFAPRSTTSRIVSDRDHPTAERPAPCRLIDQRKGALKPTSRWP
jgi:transposase-like protein